MNAKSNQEATQKNLDSSAASKKTNAVNGKQAERIPLSPEQVQVLVMRQLNQVNAKKDELTIAVKQLGDLATQLSNVCANQSKLIEELKADR